MASNLLQVSFSDVVSLIALAVAVLALVQSTSYRRRDHLLDVTRERAELNAMMASMSHTLGDLGEAIRFGGRPSISLSRHEPKQTLAELSLLYRSLDSLQVRLAAVPSLDSRLARRQAEAALSALINFRSEANSMVSEVEAFRQKVAAAHKSGVYLP
ncbi:hypothetical protein [Tabrizicola aquatica]|uniref:hypothetical protein n=1 Tax=Tabrizicola aquatica TaxID=909926 RepID=UPI000CD12D69|nr:hypothetical protein [Tabrizicola aquatica]